MANPLDSFKNLPTWGKVGVFAGSGAVVYYMYKKRQAANSTSTQTGTDPITGLPYSEDSQTDPQTGLTYLAEAQQYGSVAAADEALAGVSAASTGYGTGGYGLDAYNSSGYGTGVGTTSGYGSNAAWAQAAETGLTSVGYSATDVAAALGAYLNGSPLTAAQASIVMAAIAEYGSPPVGSFSIVAGASDTNQGSSGAASTGSNTGTPVSSGSSTVTTTGSDTSTVTTPASTPIPVIGGGHVISVYSAGGTVGWTATNATSFHVMLTGPGSENGRTNTVTKPQASYSGLESGHNYEVTVTPYNSAGQAGKSGVITFKTT